MTVSRGASASGSRLAGTDVRWTTSPREGYDPIVDRASSTSGRHVRPTPSMRGALLAGFGVVFGLWLLSGYQLIRSLQDVESRVNAMHESFVRGERTRSAVRNNVLLGSIYLRDALVDSGTISRDYYRNEIRQIRMEIEQLLPAYLLEVELPIEREHWRDLQFKLARYWDTLDLVFSPDLPSSNAAAAAMLNAEVVPARNDVLGVVDTLSALQRLSQQLYQIEASLMYREVWINALTIVLVAVALGIVVASVAFWRIGRLEREIHRKSRAESQNRQDLERLSARLVDAQEQERRNLARELHDEVGQALTAIKMGVGVALRSVEHDPRARASLEDARALAEGTLQCVRDLSQLLHPSMLDDFGLPETLTAYLRSFSTRTGIRAQLVPDGLDARLPADVEVCIYRIVQEAMTNVARHSGAQNCTVSVSRRAAELRLCVEDDGRGIGMVSPRAPHGLGLIGMRERAQALSGRFVIENRPEGGTRLVVVLPVPVAVDESGPSVELLAG
jgi:signal transduction histidine kinase